MSEVITKDSFKTDLNGNPTPEHTRRALILMGTGGKLDIGKEKTQ